MIEPQKFVGALAAQELDFYVGVPDSLLKDFCAYVEDHGKFQQHIITANEGNAVAMACGYYMATGRSAVVYLQNSGLGNVINPLTSIADSEVYQIPMLLIIGWRGEPGFKDEPQHIKQGRITAQQLELLGIPYRIVSAEDEPSALVSWASVQLEKTRAPVALLIKNGAFAKYTSKRKSIKGLAMKREDALTVLLELAGDASIVATTGKTSREVFELRKARGDKQRDFLTVGGMGHTASIALGVALGKPEKQVVCIDGDGSVIMHLGALPIIGSVHPANFSHVLLNNAAHESVGGQPTVADRTDFRAISRACGYKAYELASTPDEIREAWHRLQSVGGPTMLEVQIAIGSRDDLGRPTTSTHENKKAFMDWLRS